ncbi:cell division initiation protein [Breznakia sp. PF5-3]|uniref:DivIVA domain-containing protein n=1 Tax=unclassified Breznakia TaxID=2623764 RepID=UPI002404FBCD|nr:MULTISPECIES: DivIVA domain-containing protein [unclassified Breznakia]MDL2276442.1 DivIVA domain-containing protein [Breznakia sp. OttesenSCG-928-G09]MDF9825033.1 cell division initiation protein [Breznakia sp. PM6-1]MDF9835396.1 cell division initiation protein [Breznakia sp. PF5-3]MDF9837628.1 cell division initiation protein [Breznakia sp. PFB2-8]MDF9859492.1 cell division initiation protein [Breznakia sp. PH5-24]
MQFDTMNKGYNRFQVDDALSKAQEEIDELKKKLDAYKKQSEEDQKCIQKYKVKYEQLSRDLEIKEQAAKDMTRIALSEANSIVNSANNNADMIIKEALLNARTILIKISKLGIEANEIKVNLNEQLALLSDTIDGFDIPPIPNVELIEKKYKD